MKTIRNQYPHNSKYLTADIAYMLAHGIDFDVKHGPAGVDVWVEKEYEFIFHPHLTLSE